MKCPNDGIELELNTRKMYECRECGFNLPPNTKEMKQVYAWVSVDENGMEGLFGAKMPNGVLMLLCSSEYKMAVDLRDIAERSVSTIPGYRARLVKFTRSEVIE